jgi:hypothetical protein
LKFNLYCYIAAADGGELDPLAFWKELQSQHRAEADELTGVEAGAGGGGGSNRRQRGGKKGGN